MRGDNMNKVIAYVGTSDLAGMLEADILKIDIINIAFGHIHDSVITWETPDNIKDSLARIRNVNPEIKLILSIGGWSAGGFSEAAMTEENRERVANSAAALVQEYGLDGVDIDWEYPCFAVAGIQGDMRDKENFTLFLAKIREKLNAFEGKMLTIAAGGDTYYVLNTNMAEAQKYLDYVQLMTYDLQGGFIKVTGHHASLYPGKTNLFDVCVDKAVKVFKEAGVPAEKLIVGIPFYSRMWKGVKGGKDGIGLEAETVGTYGPGYADLVEKFVDKNGYKRYWDDIGKAPYLFNGDEFISYDDEEGIKAKAVYVKEQGLGGMMFWEYQCDPTGALLNCMYESLKK